MSCKNTVRHQKEVVIKAYLLSCFNLNDGQVWGFDFWADVQKVRSIFEQEMNHEVSRFGRVAACENWLRGLCGTCEVEFKSYQISLMLGGLFIETEGEYWRTLANHLVQLMNGRAPLNVREAYNSGKILGIVKGVKYEC